MKLRSFVLAQMVMFHTAQWSPDGTQLLITRLGDGHTIWAEQPDLSPDGRSILYEAREEPHDVLSSWIVVVDTSGANPKRLHRGTDPSWSPDGQRIAFKTSVNGVLHITTIGAGGGLAAVLAPGVHPAWSPDGRRLSYMVEGPTRSDIWIMNADGSSKRCLTCSVRGGKTKRPGA